MIRFCDKEVISIRLDEFCGIIRSQWLAWFLESEERIK